MPSPIDTSRVSVPASLAELSEQLARNAHELWADERIRQGWRHGARRDDIKKEHPGLIPYDELSEGEKAFDRRISMETLKAILSMGFRIERSGSAGL